MFFSYERACQFMDLYKKQQKHLKPFVNLNIFLLAKTIFRLPTSRKRVMSLYNAVNTLKYQYVAKVDLLFPKPSKVYDSVDIIEQKPIIQICNFHLALLSYFDNDLWSHKLIIFRRTKAKIVELNKKFSRK